MEVNVHFPAFDLSISFILLALIRGTSRAALSTRFRTWLSKSLPWWASDSLLFLTQWWVILAAILTVELVVTKANIWAVIQATVDVKGELKWLATLSTWACPACILTFALCFVGIAAQVQAAWHDARAGRRGWHRDLRWVLQYPRDVALQVLFMPMVYHLMMCRSMLRRWAVFSQEEGSSFRHRNIMAAEADAAVAEMYDAYALWCFGNLGMSVADRELKRLLGGLAQSDVFAVLQGTLMFGVKAYAFTAVLGALYSIVLTFVTLTVDHTLCNAQAAHGPNATVVGRLGGQGSGVCAFTGTIYGANFATSTIAIYSLFSFERQLAGPLEKFHPAQKFWSMKIPVTLSFSELMLLKLTQPITGLSTEVCELLDVMTKAYFMVLVSLLNVFAWKPCEEWYQWEELCEEAPTNLLPGEEATSSDADTASESEYEDAEECLPVVLDTLEEAPTSSSSRPSRPKAAG